jgi:hypothetical protein
MEDLSGMINIRIMCVTPGHRGDQLKNIWIMEKEQISDILFF